MRKHGSEAFNSFRLHHFATESAPLIRFAGYIRKIGSPSGVERLQAALQKFASDSSTPLGAGSPAGFVDLAWQGTEPVWNENRDVCVLWRGELFQDANELTTAARGGQTGTPALGLWILQQYEKGGTASLKNLNGWFSGILVDLRNSSATLFIDRFGFKRLYCHEASHGFYFASEAKFLLAACPELRRLDLQSLGEWLSCGAVLQGRTLFNGIKLLPGAAAWTFMPAGKVTRNTYFEPGEWSSLPAFSRDGYEENLRALFPVVLKRYFDGNTLGMSLTGGLDGRMIMSWAPITRGELPCYTFNGPFRDCADVRLARRIARECGQKHESIPVGEEFLRAFPTLARDAIVVSDGAMDVSGAAELYVNRLAKGIAPIRMTGNYGSEILRRYVAFRPGTIDPALFSGEVIESGALARETYGRERSVDTMSFIAFKQVPWHHYSRLSIEQSQLTVRSPFLDNDLVRLAFQAPPECATALEPSLRLIAAGNAALARIPTDRGITWPARPVSNRIQRHYHELWAKAEYAYDYGMPQWLARMDHAVAPLHLERLFLGRQKFCHFRHWYAHDLRDFVGDTLTPSALKRSYLQDRPVAQAVAGHLKGRANHTTLIHKLLSLELLQTALLN